MADLEGPEKRRRRGFRLTAQYQVTGWRFLLRRQQHALVRRDTRMIDDPQKAQASPLILSLVLAFALGVGAVVWGLFAPGGLVKDAKIVANKDTNALYVRIGDHLNPVTNLTSARLIVGSDVNPVRASSAEIGKYPSGSLVGIVGAPVDIRDSSDSHSTWTVCDTTMTGAAVPLDPVSGLPTTAKSPVTTTVIGGPLSEDQDIAPTRAAAVRIQNAERPKKARNQTASSRFIGSILESEHPCRSRNRSAKAGQLEGVGRPKYSSRSA